MNEMKQQLSALMDGEVDMDVNLHLIAAATNNTEIAESWATYHLIGDVLRGDHALKQNITAMTMQQLKQEPVVLAPKRPMVSRWLDHRYATSMAASVAAIAFVGWAVWQAQGITPQPGTMQTIAQQTVKQQNPSPQQVAQQNSLPAETFNQYMLAHHEYASSNAMQYAGDVKTVSYSESQN